jgi:predicted phosphoribosyltransferase
MYERSKEQMPAEKPASGVATAEAVAKAVVKAIREDLPEVIVNPVPVRPLMAIQALAPRLAERLSGLIDANKLFKQQAEIREREREAAHL